MCVASKKGASPVLRGSVFSGLLFADLLHGCADVVPLRLVAVEVCVDGLLVPEQVYEGGALFKGEEDRRSHPREE